VLLTSPVLLIFSSLVILIRLRAKYPPFPPQPPFTHSLYEPQNKTALQQKAAGQIQRNVDAVVEIPYTLNTDMAVFSSSASTANDWEEDAVFCAAANASSLVAAID